MKTTITSLAIAAFALLGSTPQAEAGPRHSSRIYISGYQSCGTPIYRERYFIGYDSCGRPIWGTRVVRRYSRPAVRQRYVEPCRSDEYRHRDYNRDHRYEIEASFGRW